MEKKIFCSSKRSQTQENFHKLVHENIRRLRARRKEEFSFHDSNEIIEERSFIENFFHLKIVFVLEKCVKTRIETKV